MTDTAVTIHNGDMEHLPAAQTAEPARAMVDYVQYAIERGADLAMVEKLMDLQQRRESELAVRAFNAAMAAAKAEIPVINKNRHVGYEGKNGASSTSYAHEDLAEIARTIDPILARHGLSYRFRTISEINQPVIVTCIVAHRDGHSETNTLMAGRDDSGKKNLIQQIGSTITYLQRYTLKAALGLAAGHDDDGKASGSDVLLVSDEQIETLQTLIRETETRIGEFLTAIGFDSLSDIPTGKFDEVLGKLEKKKRLLAEKRSKEAPNA